ncbi:hypothetical protein SCHPADRAFT_1003110 [Schizopora paradoxa]|uniref:MYND-type domain-containing protein n=1 Tax=Schizopora paradoxa TaxID=27342 RepID=A0A0H2R6C2_9AGAM|nr:hypothetical protein SCHPADRAFT_1003110 [Schizopora paradoxa]
MTPSGIANLIKNSKLNLSAFMELTAKFDEIPGKNLMEYVEVCQYHLRKPVEEAIPVRGYEVPILLIVTSLVGVSRIDSDTIRIENALRRLVEDCLPDIIKWGKAITNSNPVLDIYKIFCDAMGTIFNLILIMSGSILESQDAYELAIDLWKGKDFSGVDCHTTKPLLGCVSKLPVKDLKGLLDRTGYDSAQIVKKFADRLKRSLASNPSEHPQIIIPACLLEIMADASPKTISDAVLYSELTTIMSSSLAGLVKEKDCFLFRDSVMSLLRFLNRCIQAGPDNVEKMVKSGFLYGVLESSSVYPGDKDSATFCMENLLPSLVHERALWSVFNGFHEVFTDGQSLSNLLRKSRGNFQSAWGTFQALLVEQLLLSRLFDGGYARERGACANQICNTIRDRKDLKKCAGCGFMLYCSEYCQEQSWPSHRMDCKRVEADDEREYNDVANRFSRKVATAQINRYWLDILALAKIFKVPVETLGIRVNYSRHPFKIGVFDYRPFTLNDEVNLSSLPHSNLKLSHYPMVAKEVLRRSQKGHRCIMLVVVRFDGRELPSLIYLEDETRTPSIPAPGAPLSKHHNTEVISHYADVLSFSDLRFITHHRRC